MIKGVVFDLGRTLIYLKERCSKVDAVATAALVDFLRTSGVPVDQDFAPRFLAAREVGWKLAEQRERDQKIDEVLLAILPFSDAPAFKSIVQMAVETYFEVRERYWLVNPDAVEMLAILRGSGLRLGAISNSEHDGLMRRAVERLGLAPYLHPVITSARANWRKPNPRIFQLIVDEWGLRPDEIVMVGDSLLEDIAGAQRAGMRGILFEHVQKSPKRKSAPYSPIKPDAITHHLGEIPAAIARLQHYLQ